jgi:hypothetical protein
MENNVFLHFINPDYRRYLGLYSNLKEAAHSKLISRCLNLAVFLSNQYTLLPPSFLECPMTFSLIKSKKDLLLHRLIRFPMREVIISDFIEKKLNELGPVFKSYPFVDALQMKTMEVFLEDMCETRIYRAAKIGDTIAEIWPSKLDIDPRWKVAISKIPAQHVELLLNIPKLLRERGLAIVWGNMQPLIPRSLLAISNTIELLLYLIYHNTYLEEYGAVTLTSLPAFDEPCDKFKYDYHSIRLALEPASVFRYILDAEPNDIAMLRKTKGYSYFSDVWCNACKKATDLKYIQRFFALPSKTMLESAKFLEDRHSRFKQQSFESSLKRVESLEYALYISAQRYEIDETSHNLFVQCLNTTTENQDDKRIAVRALENAFSIHLENRPAIENKILEETLRTISESSDYHNNAPGKVLVDSVMVSIIRFLNIRLEVTQKTLPRISYLFEHPGKSLPTENDLQNDFFEYATGFLPGVEIEVNNVGSGRADIRFSYRSERLIIEVKRELNDSSFQALTKAYAAQTTEYQNVGLRIGILLVLDLTRTLTEGTPHIESLINVQKVNRTGENESRFVIIVKVPGRRLRPSDLTKNAKRRSKILKKSI